MKCECEEFTKTIILFDFEKLEVYQKLRITNVSLLKYIHQGKCDDKFLADQLRRAALSVTLNLAEGVGRRTGPDKRRFITMARSSLYETVSILQILYDLEQIDQKSYDVFYEECGIKNAFSAVPKLLKELCNTPTPKHTPTPFTRGVAQPG